MTENRAVGVLDGVFGTVRHGLVAEGRVGPSLIRSWCMPIKAGRPERSDRHRPGSSLRGLKGQDEKQPESKSGSITHTRPPWRPGALAAAPARPRSSSSAWGRSWPAGWAGQGRCEPCGMRCDAGREGACEPVSLALLLPEAEMEWACA